MRRRSREELFRREKLRRQAARQKLSGKGRKGKAKPARSGLIVNDVEKLAEEGRTILEQQDSAKQKPKRSATVRALLKQALRQIRKLREEVAELKDPSRRDPVTRACRKLGISPEELVELGHLALSRTQPPRPTRVRHDRYHPPGASR